MENLQADSFARDYHITAELAAKKDGTLTALRIKTLADHGYADAAANPSKFPAGLFHVCTGSYDLKAAHVEVDGLRRRAASPTAAPSASGRAHHRAHGRHHGPPGGMDPAEFRAKNCEAGAVPLQVRAGLSMTAATTTARCRRPWSASTTSSSGPSRWKSGSVAS